MRKVISQVLSGNLAVSPNQQHNKTLYYPSEYKELDLTPRQLETRYYVAHGLLNKQIARKLNVIEATIKAHVSAIFRATNIKNRASVAKYAYELGIANLNFK